MISKKWENLEKKCKVLFCATKGLILEAKIKLKVIILSV